MTPGPNRQRPGTGPLGLPPGAVSAAAVALVTKPRLWPTAVIQVAVLARPGWWRRWPPLPRPDEDYLGFRLETAYGDAGAAAVASDVLDYLRWCREARLAAR